MKQNKKTLEIILGFKPKRAAQVIAFPVFPPPWTYPTKRKPYSAYDNSIYPIIRKL